MKFLTEKTQKSLLVEYLSFCDELDTLNYMVFYQQFAKLFSNVSKYTNSYHHHIYKHTMMDDIDP
jgi:hypothetical protein